MIRLMNMNMVFLALTIAAAFGNYHVKYEAQRAAQELAAIERDIAAERERQRVLEADWSLLNEPDRLQRLAARHLSLAPIAPTQIASRGDVSARLEILEAAAEQAQGPTGRVVKAAQRGGPSVRVVLPR